MSAPATLPAGTAAGQATPDSGSRDTARRVWAIVAGSSGNLGEWYDFYVYSFCALYFETAFLLQGNTTTTLLSAAGVFAADFPHGRASGRESGCQALEMQRGP